MSKYTSKIELEKLRNKVINRWGPNDTDATRIAELSLFAEINSLPSIDFEEMIKEMIKKYEYLSAKYLQESDIKTGLIDFKRMSDVAKGTSEELRSLINKLPK